MIAALAFAAMLAQAAGGPHFSADPDSVSTPGAAQTPAPSVAPPTRVVAPIRVQAAVKVGDDDRVTCRTVEVTGTRFGTKRCLTQSQWVQQARDAKDTYEAWSSGGAITGAH